MEGLLLRIGLIDGESMKKKIFLYVQLFAALSAAAYFMSCGFLGTTIPIRTYYLIDYTPQFKIPPGSQRPYPVSMEIDRFRVERIFNNEKIVYRFNPLELQYYEYENWAVRPEYRHRWCSYSAGTELPHLRMILSIEKVCLSPANGS